MSRLRWRADADLNPCVGRILNIKNLDEKTDRKLEKRIETAIREVITDMGLKRLPLLPSQQTMHLMAKAAVAVYEAAVENYDRGRPSEEPVRG